VCGCGCVLCKCCKCVLWGITEGCAVQEHSAAPSRKTGQERRPAPREQRHPINPQSAIHVWSSGCKRLPPYTVSAPLPSPPTQCPAASSIPAPLVRRALSLTNLLSSAPPPAGPTRPPLHPAGVLGGGWRHGGCTSALCICCRAPPSSATPLTMPLRAGNAPPPCGAVAPARTAPASLNLLSSLSLAVVSWGGGRLREEVAMSRECLAQRGRAGALAGQREALLKGGRPWSRAPAP